MAKVAKVPSVNNAVEQLEELADRMRCDFGFGDNDVNNIDQVIDALRELEVQRTEAHESLEAETIKASIQRHKLQFLPQRINKEIQDAVNSARQSNADALAYLKKQLQCVQEHIVYLGERQQVMDLENSVLHPERELIRQQHEEIISQLNQRMAEKASMQIQLNETRDKVRQTNQDIVDLEDGILQLKEDLIQERTEARQEKRQLKKAVANTTDKTADQKQLNIDKKLELDNIHEELVQSEAKLDSLRKSIRRYETSKAKQEGQERALNAQLQKQLKQNEELKKKGTSLMSEDATLEREFTEQQSQMKLKLARMEDEIDVEKARFEEMDKQRQELTNDHQGKLLTADSDRTRVMELDEQLQREKRQLSLKAEEVGKLQADNIEMTEQIENLGESHKMLLAEQQRREEEMRTPTSDEDEYEMTAEERAAYEAAEEEERLAVVAQMNKQIEDYRAELALERKERLDVQDKKTNGARELDSFKEESQRFLQEMNDTVQKGKVDHMKLTNESEESEQSSSEEEEPAVVGAQLQKQLREDESDIKKLEEELEEEQRQYQKVFSELQNKVETVEREVIEMEHSIAEKRNKIEERTPAFEEMEKKFQERTEIYDTMKKNIVDLKGQKATLTEAIKKAREMKEKLQGPQDHLKQDLKKKRGESMFQMKHHNEQTQAVEQEIYHVGCKLKTVLEENHKLEEGCKKMQQDIDGTRQQMEDNETLKQKLLVEMEEVKAELMKSWDEDNEILQLFSERDQHTVDGLGDLVDKTGRREQKISEISVRLNEELGYLSQFLDNLASRRPKVREVLEELTRGDKAINKRRGAEQGQQSRQSSRKTRSQSSRKPDGKSEDVQPPDESTPDV